MAGTLKCGEIAEPLIGKCENEWALRHSVIRLNLTEVISAVRTGLHFIGAQV